MRDWKQERPRDFECGRIDAQGSYSYRNKGRVLLRNAHNAIAREAWAAYVYGWRAGKREKAEA